MRDRIRFWLGAERHELSGFPPWTTLLDWLRGPGRRSGVKEGCAEGDCGACTVLLTRLVGSALVHEPVCACIRLLATVDGCRILTAEDLAGPDGGLHPIQRAMIAEHASQCGFCTPGIVGALVAARLASPARPNEDDIDRALAGNLCRCTGYAAIARAVHRAHDLLPPEADPLRREEEGWRARLDEPAEQRAFAIEGPGGTRFLAPASLAELAALRRALPEALLLAGGSDVGLWITKDLRRPSTVLWLGRVDELARIEENEQELRLGAAVTWREATPALLRLAPAMAELLDRFAGPQIRAVATIAGNLANASPVGDGSPALSALEAELDLRCGERRRSLPLADFFRSYRTTALEPGEFVEAVRIPRPHPATRLAFYKLSKRRDQDISAVMAAFAVRVEDGRITRARLAFGGMAAIPARAHHAEAALEGEPWSEETIERAAAALARDFAPISDHRASADYRRAVAADLLRRFRFEQDRPGAFPVRLHEVGPIAA